MAAFETVLSTGAELDLEQGVSPNQAALPRTIVAESLAMKAVLERVMLVADAPSTTVLLSGESGTGKEMIATAIHALSDRHSKRFIDVNCGAIPASLLESEFFGHTKGAFSGAVAARRGKFELANGGTLFLDEISELPLDLQPKFLRALQERVVCPLGSMQSVPIDTRIVAASNRDLGELVRQGGFREDLYYRLNVFPIRLPPLRERPVDIIPLANHFLAHFSREFEREFRLSRSAARLLSSYSFPGNIRELRNIIESAVVCARSDEIQADGLRFDSLSEAMPTEGAAPLADEAFRGDTMEHRLPGGRSSSAQHRLNLPTPVPSGPPTAKLPTIDGRASLTGETMQLEWGDGALDRFEREIVFRALRAGDGNRTVAAKLLGITRQSLMRRVAKFGLDAEVSPEGARDP